MEHRSCQCTVPPCHFKNVLKVGHFSGATGGDERNPADFSDPTELFQIIATPNAILVHAVQYDFTGTAVLCFRDPFQRAV